MIIIFAIATIFLVLSIVFLNGKGAFLISGYNTATPAQKQQYNLKRLTRVMGVGTGVLSLLLFVYALPLPTWGYVILGVIFLADVICIIVLSNTYAKTKPHEQAPPPPQSSNQKKRSRAVLIFAVVFIVAIATFVGFMLFTGDIGAEITNDEIILSATFWVNYTIRTSEIHSVTYSETLNVGRRTSGVGSFVHYGGNFHNDEFGNYILYAYAAADSSVIIETDSGIVVVGLKTDAETRAFLQNIEALLQT